MAPAAPICPARESCCSLAPGSGSGEPHGPRKGPHPPPRPTPDQAPTTPWGVVHKLEEPRSFFKPTEETLPPGAGFSPSELAGAPASGRAEGGTSEFPRVHSIPGGRQGLGDNEVREDGSLMGQAQGLQAEALQETGITSRSPSPVSAEQNQNGSFSHWSVCPGHITRAPTMCTALCSVL